MKRKIMSSGPLILIAFHPCVEYVDGAEHTMIEVYIHTDLCVGCGLCEELAPRIFKVGDYHARVLRRPETKEEVELARVIMRDCPPGAIDIIPPA